MSVDPELARLGYDVIGASIEVHRHLGPGLLESIYEEALAEELRCRGIPFERQVSIPIWYKGTRLSGSHRLDLLVNGRLILEIKSVEAILDVHKAQLLSQLRLTNLESGLLINFNVVKLHLGIRRAVNRLGLTLSESFENIP
jgi:GxxExxY protein